MAVPSLPAIRHGCLLNSLAGGDPRLQLLSNGATWYPVPESGTCTCTRGQNFRVVYFSSVCSSDENKTTRKIKRRNAKISGSTVYSNKILQKGFVLLGEVVA